MKTIAALYDIHGNLPALEAVLAEVRAAGVDRIVIGGDVVPGPMPRETLEYLASIDIPLDYIRGNGDRVVLAQAEGLESAEVPPAFRDVVRWNAAQLTLEQQHAIGTWPPTTRATVDGIGGVFFCHATPRNDVDIFTRQTAEEPLRLLFDVVDAAVVVCGHTHMQFERRVGKTRVVNAGSVGMPMMQPGGAYWVLLGPDIQLRRTDYDFVHAAARVRATAYPQAEQFAANYILQPPSEEIMLAAYARAELK